MNVYYTYINKGDIYGNFSTNINNRDSRYLLGIRSVFKSCPQNLHKGQPHTVSRTHRTKQEATMIRNYQYTQVFKIPVKAANKEVYDTPVAQLFKKRLDVKRRTRDE